MSKFPRNRKLFYLKSSFLEWIRNGFFYWDIEICQTLSGIFIEYSGGNMEIAIFVSDKRMKYLMDFLKKDHHSITIISNQAQLDPILSKKFDQIILPIQGINSKGEVFCGKECIQVLEFLKNQDEKCMIYTGNHHAVLDSCHAQKVYLLQNDFVNEKNAILTAEGVLDSIIRNSESGIRETRVDVIGYGICGKALVKMLAALDCPVKIVSTRELKGEFLNGKYVETLYYPQYKIDCDILVNTAPCCMINCEMIKVAKRKPLIIDIASNAVGVESKAQKCSVIRYEYMPSIPGKYSPKSAALILYEAIKRGELH